jgi:carbon-monoxide dehydrogenase large subunit
LLSGQYVIPSISCRVKGVLTNTCPIDAERGAGRPEAAFVVERIVETAARDLGIDGIDLRRRNFIKPAQFPYQTPVALQYDIGDYEPILDEAMKAADVSGFAARKADSEKRGMMRGLGFSAYIEACGLAPSNVAGAIGAGIGLFESAEMRFDPTGSVSV